MKEFLERQERREQIQIRNWKALDSHWKHMVLMYFYRLKTDPDNLNCYIETAKFLSLGVSPDAFPDYMARMTPKELKAEAYEVIGKRHELPEEFL